MSAAGGVAAGTLNGGGIGGDTSVTAVAEASGPADDEAGVATTGEANGVDPCRINVQKMVATTER